MGATLQGCGDADTAGDWVCPPDSYRCALGAVERCPSDGAGWTVIKTCAADALCHESLCVAQSVLEPATISTAEADASTQDIVEPSPDGSPGPEPDITVPSADTTSPPEPDASGPPPTVWAAGDFVITELMPNPAAVSDSDGEWFELYNASGEARDLAGLQISDDEGVEDTLSATLVVPAGGYVVLARVGDASINGGVSADATHNGVTLSNGYDTLGVSMGGTVLDVVSWSVAGGFPSDQAGAAIQLGPEHLDAVANDLGESWCWATTTYGDGDYGSPGAPNPSCPVATGEPGDLLVTELMIDPDAVYDNLGEWLELQNTTDSAIDLQGLVLHDGEDEQNVVLGSLLLPAGGYAVLGASGDMALNGGVPVDYALEDLSLKNTADTLIVERNGVVFDTVSYSKDAGFVIISGQSMSLDPAATGAADNDDPASWCEASTPYGDGDLGSPGAANTPCTSQSCCATGDDGGCDVGACAAAVCAINDYCCENEWSPYCVACAKGGLSYYGDDCSSVVDACGCEDCSGPDAIDAYEPNDDEDQAANLGSVEDSDSFPHGVFTATVFGANDEDWYEFHDEDTVSLANFQPRVELETDAPDTWYRLCLYMRCDNGEIPLLTCDSSSPVSEGTDIVGCCDAGTDLSVGYTLIHCGSLADLFTDESGTLTVSVEQLEGEPTCEPYTLRWGDD